MLQDIIQERLMVLQLSLSNLKGTYLPRDNIDTMLSALTVRLNTIKRYLNIFLYFISKLF